MTNNGNKRYTNPASVKLAKNKFSLKVGKTAQIKATVTKLDDSKEIATENHAAELRFRSSNTAVATVGGGGKVTAKGKGTCTIYVYTVNGLRKSVKIVVS